MRYFLHFILTATVMCLFVFTSASAAHATPVTWQSVDVLLHADADGAVMAVSGTLPDEAPLPAEAELSVPAGSPIQWIGEIMGGPPAEDPDLTYTKSTVDGVDVYRFTLTRSRIAQIEVHVDDVVAFDGTNYSTNMLWESAQDLPEVRMGVKLPEDVRIVSEAQGAALQPGSPYSYYAKTVEDVKSGDVLDFAFGYSVSQAPAAGTGGAAASGTGQFAQTVLVLIGLAGAIVFVIAIRRGMAAKAADGGSVLNPGAISIEDAKTDLDPGRSGVRASAEDTADIQDSDVPESEDAEPPAGGQSAVVRRNRLTIAVIAIFLVAVVVVAVNSNRPHMTGNSITRTFAVGEPCVTASIPLVAADDDPTATSETLFSALGSVGGIKSATYDIESSTLEVGFCDSEISESAIRQALAPTALLLDGAP